ncbi:auxin-responsive protein SAUR50-like [Impatiens glandulifera]|uniref:auxin-responsive protein SAUR50-like n=1 Tax=Impatiens glandulifera TaxID=253017 RepID=UPI001FB0C303|nr:auxin-responsive protein SAUR50-like [Impatiens glandulifera]
MASAVKKVNKISQIVRLKQIMLKWKNLSIKRRTVLSCIDENHHSDDFETDLSGPITPSGSVAVYVGEEHRRFVIPTRFLNLPVFVSLLDQAAEEFGFKSNRGLSLPCEIHFFEKLIDCLENDELTYAGIELEGFLEMFVGTGDDYCNESVNGDKISTRLQKSRA